MTFHIMGPDGKWVDIDNPEVKQHQMMNKNFDKGKVTRLIAGREITLIAGERYLAALPLMSPSRSISRFYHDKFPVRIKRLTGVARGLSVEDYEIVLEGFSSYEEANEFLSAFNNGPEGRVW